MLNGTPMLYSIGVSTLIAMFFMDLYQALPPPSPLPFSRTRARATVLTDIVIQSVLRRAVPCRAAGPVAAHGSRVLAG